MKMTVRMTPASTGGLVLMESVASRATVKQALKAPSAVCVSKRLTINFH